MQALAVGCRWSRRRCVVAPAVAACWVAGALGQPPGTAGQPAGSGVPAALVDGNRVEWSDLTTPLAEAAGGLILEEVVLDRTLAAECARRGLSVEQATIEAERDLLARALTAAANVPQTEAETLLARVRLTRGLGDYRFAALLKRNAMLRALVRCGRIEERVPEITEEDLRQAYALKYGQRVRTRIILVRRETAAGEALRRIRGDGRAAETFADVAADVSIDPSAARGGLIEPFSLDDAAYPVAIRRVLAQLQPGTVSEPIAVAWGSNEGYAIVKLEGTVAPPEGAPALEACKEDLRTEVQIVRERAAMDRLARRLVAGAKVTIFDRSLDRSWSERNGPPGP